MTEENASEDISDSPLKDKEVNNVDTPVNENNDTNGKNEPSNAHDNGEDQLNENNEENSNSELKKKGPKKRKKSLEPQEEVIFEKRERSSRGAKTKAALQISLSTMKENTQNFIETTDEVEENGVLRPYKGRGRKSKVLTSCEVLSASPYKLKPGPRSKKKPLKPGPRSKRGRNFQFEDLYLEQISIDEMPKLNKYKKALAKLKPDKPLEKLKAVVSVLDIKDAQNPCTKAAYEIANDYYQTVGQFKGINDLVTITYQKPKVTSTSFQHKPDPSRIKISQPNQTLPTKPIQLPTAPPPAPSIPDPTKPPPITNYMSVKIETLMNCLEKMYHHHLPLNAFTSRFPNARAKAMLTMMLDGHRNECTPCSKVLEDANVGVFHSDEEKLKMDLDSFGPALPTSAPIVDLSQYPDDVAAMKKLLVEKDAKIKV